jgi:hypothetical protein
MPALVATNRATGDHPLPSHSVASPRKADSVIVEPVLRWLEALRRAEELATIDVLSRRRLDMGFVKGVPYEFPVSNQNAVGVMERFWEAHDFIIKAMSDAQNLDKISVSRPASRARDITFSEHRASRRPSQPDYRAGKGSAADGPGESKGTGKVRVQRNPSRSKSRSAVPRRS